MPEATYIPLEGSSSRGYFWTSLSSLEKILIILSATLAIFVVALTIAIVSNKCSDNPPSNSTTTTTTSTTSTTSSTIPPEPSTEPSTEPPTTTSPAPNNTQLSKSTIKPVSVPLPITSTPDNVDVGTTEASVKSETET